MDIQSVLRATFPPPLIEPDWQTELLLQLGADPADVAGHAPAHSTSNPPEIELHGSGWTMLRA